MATWTMNTHVFIRIRSQSIFPTAAIIDYKLMSLSNKQWVLKELVQQSQDISKQLGGLGWQ